MFLLVSFAAEETKDIPVKDIILKAPTTWKQEPPANKLRTAQFQIPAVEGDKEPATLVISTFDGGGGDVADNLKRWSSDFTGDDKQVKVTQGASPQGDYVFNEASGTYLKSIGPPVAGKKEPTPGYRSLSVILMVPGKGTYYLRLTGPDKTVKAAADGFRGSFGGDAAKEKPYEAK